MNCFSSDHLPADSGPAEPAVGEPIVDGIIAWAELGTGPHCATWAAWSIEHWCPVVIKLPLRETEPDRALAALRREESYLRDLHHPAFIRLLRTHLDGPTPHLIMEAIEGRTVAQMLEDGPLSPVDVLRLAQQLLSAVQYLHRRGIVHLDLKPGNLMIRNGRVMVLDFGAAQPIGVPLDHGPRGTDGYMAPEHERLQAVDPSMDLYSIGLILREALAGRWMARLRLQARQRRAASLLLPAIDRLLSVDPLDRPVSAIATISMLGCDGFARLDLWAPPFADKHLPE